MQYHLLIGPDPVTDDLAIMQIQNAFIENGHSLYIYGDNKKKINCDALNLPNGASIIINGHGSITVHDYKIHHNLELCHSGYSTHDSLKEISANKSMNFELFSCYGGSAIYDVPGLSTLITLTSNYHLSTVVIAQELLKRSASFREYNNPFITFAYYLFISPDTAKFAVNSKNNHIHYFSSLIEFLKNYSTYGIRKWQEGQLDKFIDFLNKIKNNVDQHHSIQIHESLTLFKDNYLKNEWLKQFDTNRYKELLLMNMISREKVEVVKNILESGIDVHVKITGGGTALDLAIIRENIEIVNILIEEGFPINTKDIDDNTPLHRAAGRGNIKIVNLLIEAGNSLDIPNANGHTAMLTAAQNGHAAVVNALIDAGSFPNSKDANGHTALHAASQNGHTEVVNTLIGYGASINEKSNGGSFALLLASYGGHIESVKALIRAKALVNIESNDGYTSLDIAGYIGNIEVTIALLASGANAHILNLADNDIAAIVKEANLFALNPIKYILEHNNEARFALNAIKNLEEQSYLSKLLPEIMDCLEAQPEGIIDNLNDICGEGGLYYSYSAGWGNSL